MIPIESHSTSRLGGIVQTLESMKTKNRYRIVRTPQKVFIVEQRTQLSRLYKKIGESFQSKEKATTFAEETEAGL